MSMQQVARGNASPQPHVPCRVCGAIKPKSGFYKGHVRSDDSAGECKDCTKARVRHRARTNPGVQAYDRDRAKLPHRRAKTRQITAKWRIENPVAYAAQTAVGNALRDGKIAKQPCMFCGEKEVHAHHRDYSRPLDVVWLCPKCHHRLHATFPETQGLLKGRGK